MVAPSLTRPPSGAGARSGELRRLVVVLGDQLDPASSALDDFDPQRDALWMAEVAEETEHVWAHRKRIAVFLSAMRHFRDEQRALGRQVHYTELPGERARDRAGGHGELLEADLAILRPRQLVVVRPGDLRVQAGLQRAAAAHGLGLEVRPDRHFYETPASFDQWADRREGALLLESFYRHMRRKHRVLLTAAGGPLGGRWNYDAENRARYPRSGPPPLPALPAFAPDATTRAVLDLVRARFPEHPGQLDDFALPVTSAQAQVWLDDFIQHRLPLFGRYEDAMWHGQPLLNHSRLSLPLNLKLLDPRRCVQAAVAALEAGRAPLASVEGFIRQILGWREYVHGIYFRHMPAYREMNALGCEDRPVPPLFWNGETHMACVRDATSQLVRDGYTHHIQRLMVLGGLALGLGVHPRRFHEWHLAMYLDAVDWVSLPNALGMSQYGDGGIVGTKPYIAGANYINKMSNHCKGCRYNPAAAVGDDACPFNALYYDFLARHRERLSGNARLKLQMAGLDRLAGERLIAIRRRADEVRRRISEPGVI